MDNRCQPPGSIAYCPFGSANDGTCTTNFWLTFIRKADCTLCSEHLAWSTEWWFHFLDPFRCEPCNSSHATFRSATGKKENLKSRLLVKCAALAQNLCPQAHWANCPLLQSGNNSDYCVFCLLENQNKLPAHGSLLLFHTNVQTLAVNSWKECLTVWVCITVFWNNFSINQTLSLVSLSFHFFFFFWVLFLFCRHCWSLTKDSQSSRWGESPL